jgi:hypothetical protein
MPILCEKLLMIKVWRIYFFRLRIIRAFMRNVPIKDIISWPVVPITENIN